MIKNASFKSIQKISGISSQKEKISNEKNKRRTQEETAEIRYKIGRGKKKEKKKAKIRRPKTKSRKQTTEARGKTKEKKKKNRDLFQSKRRKPGTIFHPNAAEQPRHLLITTCQVLSQLELTLSKLVNCLNINTTTNQLSTTLSSSSSSSSSKLQSHDFPPRVSNLALERFAENRESNDHENHETDAPTSGENEIVDV